VTEPSAGLRAALAGRYDIERELGEGGMAVVYLARDLKHDRPVALKILRPDVAVGLGVERFVREIRVVAQLQHPHILPLFDSGEADGLPYFVTPYIEGESLHDRLVRDRQLPLGEALSIARQVAGALAYAHSRGIVHRDIKPANILLEGGEAIVADFGIALALSAARLGRRMTESGLALGTPTYMSPEQAAGAEVLDHRSDLYSLGCVLYEMLAGAPPFPAPTPQAVVASHLHDTPAPLSALRSALPPVLEQTVERALAKSPDDRFDTATAFVAALDRAAPALTASRLRRWWGRRAVRVGAAVLGIAAVALVGQRAFRRDLFARCTRAFAQADWSGAQLQCHRAALADPGFGPAHLWLAEASLLGGRPDSEWSSAARRAVTHMGNLRNFQDSMLAYGLLDLVDSQYATACRHYRNALARDTMDVLAWLGVGDCQRLDAGVVRDPGPGGWRFRSSYWGAFSAYRRALEAALAVSPALGPAVYERVAQLLLVDQAKVRLGRGVRPDTGLFMGYPALDHDTLLLVPYPWVKAQTLPPPASRDAAVARGRSLLQDLVGRWVGAAPRSGRAHAARARSLEVEGVLGGEGAGARSALAETGEALHWETDSLARVDLGVAQVRLYLKLLRLHDAARAADSMLAAAPDPAPEVAARLAAVAALLGRAHLAAFLFSRAVADTSFRLPAVALTVKAAAQRLLAYAALGAPAESISVLAARVDTLVERWVLPPDRERVRHALLDDAAMLAFPAVHIDAGGPPAVQHFQYQAQWLLWRGDTAGARRVLDAVGRSERASLVPAALFPVQTYHEAVLLLAVRDTAEAQWLLDLGLDNLSAAPTFIMSEPQQSGSLVRAMALRARLAAKTGEAAAARRWTAAVDTLWSACDPELRTLVDSLGALRSPDRRS
jgi:hypothetical protein